MAGIQMGTNGKHGEKSTGKLHTICKRKKTRLRGNFSNHGNNRSGKNISHKSTSASSHYLVTRRETMNVEEKTGLAGPKNQLVYKGSGDVVVKTDKLVDKVENNNMSPLCVKVQIVPRYILSVEPLTDCPGGNTCHGNYVIIPDPFANDTRLVYLTTNRHDLDPDRSCSFCFGLYFTKVKEEALSGIELTKTQTTDATLIYDYGSGDKFYFRKIKDVGKKITEMFLLATDNKDIGNSYSGGCAKGNGRMCHIGEREYVCWNSE